MAAVENRFPQAVVPESCLHPLGMAGPPCSSLSSFIITASVLPAVSIVVVIRFRDFFSFDHESVLVDLRREVYRK